VARSGKVIKYASHVVDESDIRAVTSVLCSDALTQGPVVKEFEQAVAGYCGAKYGIAVSSGTAALILAYRVLRKHRILTTPISFVATANAAVLNNMDVLFWDTDADTGNATLPIYSDVLLVPVHLAGRRAFVPKLDNVVEDAAHALGGRCWDDCSPIGSCAHSMATCLSFHAIKSVSAGEGGMILTNSEELAARLRLLRSHGRNENGEMVELAGNFRMDEMSAALGLSQLRRLDAGVRYRAGLAEMYTELLSDVEGVKCPLSMPGGAWHLYTARVDPAKRAGIRHELQEKDIETSIHYPAIHLQPFYRQRFGFKPGDFSNAEAWAAEELSLPLHVGMTEADVQTVVDALKEALK
jgi:perosamine synthetase